MRVPSLGQLDEIATIRTAFWTLHIRGILKIMGRGDMLKMMRRDDEETEKPK
jgi:hypothetical protein